MDIQLTIKKGLDLNLDGNILSDKVTDAKAPASVAVIPDDFPGLTPKPDVKDGDSVRAGDPLFHDKLHEEIKVVSPVAGTVRGVIRGERRKIMRIVVEPSEKAEFKTFEPVTSPTADKVKQLLLESGLWAMIHHRPYGIVARPDDEPRDIFVTAIDTAPLAPSMDVLLKGKEKELQAGADAIATLTKGKVYIGRSAAGSVPTLKGVTTVDITGPHPAGNAGTIIANIRPINKGETVWTLDGVTLARIGALMLTGRVDMTAVVAVDGSEIKNPGYYSTVIGADMASLLDGNIKPDGADHRIISGNVLTGYKSALDDYLRFPYTQVTVIPEGDHADEFMGWASLSPSKMSVSRSFPGHFLKRKFNPDARILGGRRAMIMSGEYDSVMPMDIMAEYLIKAILSRDIDKMEALGIYEILPEDFALAEYVDTSKLELQKIVAEGLDYLRKENE